MQIAQTDVLCLIDNNSIRIGNVQAVFDDRRAQEHIVVTPHEIQHLVFQLLCFHLPMSNANLHVRNQPMQDIVDGRKFFHLVV